MHLAEAAVRQGGIFFALPICAKKGIVFPIVSKIAIGLIMPSTLIIMSVLKPWRTQHMTLENLLSGIEILKTNTDLTTQIKEIRMDSRTVCEGDLFFCMQGINDDGNDYLDSIALPFIAVTEREPENKKLAYVLVADVRKAYALACENRFLRPLDDMKFVAVIGTNGKTSTAHYISSLLSSAGIRTGLIGTEGHYILGEKVSQSLTTPNPYELNELFFKMRASGVEVVIAEVSAHAIYLEKLGDIRADVAILTNVSQDHLDYFKDYSSYQSVKEAFFTDGHAKCAIVNVDDECGRRLLGRLEGRDDVMVLSYGLNNPADCFAVNVFCGIDGISFVANLCDDIVEVKSPLYGEFNVYNLLGAMSVAHELGMDDKALSRAVRRVKGVKGRFSVFHTEKGTIIIDYAHTPEGLRELLSTARALTKARLIALFGCGGERDKTKRSLMGKIASEYSDCIVLTSDNPRGEDAEAIIKQIEWGVSIKDVKCIPDRPEAVRYALSQMEEGDTLVLAGKGNESYLEIKGKKIPYSDFDMIARYAR